MAYCCLILLGKLIQKVVFGKLRVIEHQVFTAIRFVTRLSQSPLGLTVSDRQTGLTPGVEEIKIMKLAHSRVQ